MGLDEKQTPAPAWEIEREHGRASDDLPLGLDAVEALLGARASLTEKTMARDGARPRSFRGFAR